MSPRREQAAFALVLSVILACFFRSSLFEGRVLSPADVLFATKSFERAPSEDYEPRNRLLIDPVLQFQPWLEFNRDELRAGRLPLWNPYAGRGVPHLANGQSAVFDPFHAVAYLAAAPVARTQSWMAAARLLTAGCGMFLLATSWGFGGWGRWFAGLAWPLSGFPILWLLFPVTSAAIWLPWLLWASDRALARPSPRSIAVVALCAGCTLLAGHVQTSAHVLLAAGIYAAWRIAAQSRRREPCLRGATAWTAGVALGVALAAIEVVPLAVYLTKSPVWSDRAARKASPLAITRPRVLDAACTALPYVFGSQRRGQPNIARGLGVHNLNESAGGYAGVATLLWLAPLGAWAGRKNGDDRLRFLVALGLFGACAAFDLPPVANLLRALPVLDVADNRRLTLWLGFSLVLLGGAGLDRIAETRLPRGWIALWACAACALCAAAITLETQAGAISSRARDHYARAAATTPGADPEVYAARADRQTRATLVFLPRYWRAGSCGLFAMAALALAARRGFATPRAVRAALLAGTIIELFAFGFDLNPSISPADDRPVPPVVARLRTRLKPHERTLGLGSELPPNVLMRYRLADVRNYDSIELTGTLDALEPVFEPSREARSSRRAITWAGVARARAVLEASCVAAVVAAEPPPAGVFEHVERLGDVWVAWLNAAPPVSCAHGEVAPLDDDSPCRRRFSLDLEHAQNIVVRETFDPGRRAFLDGLPAPITAAEGLFSAVDVPAGAHRLTLVYDPAEVRVAAWISVASCVAIACCLTGACPIRSTRIVGTRLGTIPAVELRSVHDLRRLFDRFAHQSRGMGR